MSYFLATKCIEPAARLNVQGLTAKIGMSIVQGLTAKIGMNIVQGLTAKSGAHIVVKA